MVEGPYDQWREEDDVMRDFFVWEMEFGIPERLQATLWPTRTEHALQGFACWWNDHMPVSTSFVATWAFILADTSVSRRIKKKRFGPWKHSAGWKNLGGRQR